MKIGKRTLYTFTVVAGLFVAALVASRTTSQHQQSRTAQQMTQQTKTVCVGRLMVDLPVDAEVTFSDARVGGVTIGVEPGYDAQKAAAAIAERVSALAGETNELGKPSLEKREVVDGINLQATLLYSGREKAVTRTRNGMLVTGDEGITVEAFALKDDLFYRLKGEALASPKYEQVVHDLVKNFASKAAAAVPEEPGFCMENGIIQGITPPVYHESVTMFATLKGHPDIAIRLDTAVLEKTPGILVGTSCEERYGNRVRQQHQVPGQTGARTERHTGRRGARARKGVERHQCALVHVGKPGQGHGCACTQHHARTRDRQGKSGQSCQFEPVG
jgi:hypothetical protein